MAFLNQDQCVWTKLDDPGLVVYVVLCLWTWAVLALFVKYRLEHK